MFWVWIRDLYEITFPYTWDFPYEMGFGNDPTRYFRLVDFFNNLRKVKR